MKKTFSSLKRLARYIRPYRGTFPSGVVGKMPDLL